ncbi:MAG: translocation/assembly module TamB domain-containing protein [Balneolaceae bacterium]
MNEKLSQRNALSGRIRYWLLIPFCILLFAAGIRMSLKSDWLLERVRGFAERQINNQIRGNLTLEELKGDLFYGISITGVRLTGPDGEAILTADSIRATYWLPNLIRQPYEIEDLVLHGMKADVRQLEDQSWNYEQLLPEPAEAETGEAAEWFIRNIRIRNSSLAATSPSLPDRRISVSGLETRVVNAGFRNERGSAELRMLNFMLNETRLNRPVEVGASAAYENREVTLERLVINSGRTFFSSHVRYDLSSSGLAGNIELEPMSWRDILSYSDSDFPLVQDLNVSIGFQGNLSDLDLEVQGTAEGLQEFSLRSSLNFENQFSMHELSATLEGLDGPRLTGDSQMPLLDSFRFEGDGAVYVSDPETSHFTARFSASGVVVNSQPLDEIQGQLDWNQDKAGLLASVSRQGQSADLSLEVGNIFADLPEWKAQADGKQINLYRWTDNEDLDSNLNFTAVANGRGFVLSDELIRVKATLTESRWGNQPFDRVDVDAGISAYEIAGRIEGHIAASRFNSEFSTTDWQSPKPDFTFSAGLDAFNLSDLAGMEGFPTHLNATLAGRGSGFDTEQLELASTVRFDSSFVNGEAIQMLEADVWIQDEILNVSRAELQSPIAEGKFSLSQHLQDFRNQDNRLDLEAEIKDISSLSPLFGVEYVNTRGRLEGHLLRQADGLLQFEGRLDLEEMVYDTLFTVEKMAGNVGVILYEEPELTLDLDLTDPATDAISLQSIRLASRSFLRDTLTTGSLDLTVMEDEENAIRYEGDYRYRENDLGLNTYRLDFQTPLRTLTLQETFDLTWKSGVFRMAPLRIATESGDAHLQLSIPYLDENRQEVEMDARLLNLGVLQQTLLNETYAEALLSGQLSLQREGTEIDAESGLLFTEVRMQEGRMDSLRMDLSLQNGRMQVLSSAWHGQKELYTFSTDVPCEPVDPMSLGEEFFEQPVEGKITLNPSSVQYWSGFLAETTNLDAEGLIRFDGEVSGTAGNPEFRGAFGFNKGSLSGVAIDSIMVDIDYLHEEKNISFVGFIESLGSRIARFESTLPLHIDLRRFRVDLPDDTDQVYVSVITDSFNLVLLNNFLDRDVFRNLRGIISGNLELKGSIANLEPDGKFILRNGGVRIVQAGIQLNQVSSDVQLSRNQIVLQSLSMRSGSGQLSASGNIALSDMQPGNIDIQVRANQFRAVNTPDMNAVVDLNGNLSGSVRNPVVGGTLRFRSGFIYLENFGDRAIEDVRFEEDEETMNIAYYDSMAIDMEVEFNRQFFIRNRQYLDMEVELAGTVDLVKQSAGELQMFGSLEGVNGYARPLGRNFVLDEAVVVFYGPVDNPELNIRTLYRPPQPQSDIRIWYIIEGTVQEPEFRFESEPFLELQDIISYTIFGQPFYALDSWKQVVASSGSNTTASDVAVEVLLDQVEMLATQQLGIDVVQIDNTRSGSGSTTSIKTGWYLNNRTFFAILNEVSATPKTLFILEYLLRENLELIITQGDDYRQGVDLRWKYDY